MLQGTPFEAHVQQRGMLQQGDTSDESLLQQTTQGLFPPNVKPEDDTSSPSSSPPLPTSSSTKSSLYQPSDSCPELSLERVCAGLTDPWLSSVIELA